MGRCFDAALTVADVEAYVDAIAQLYPSGDWAAAREAARLALVVAALGQQEAPFQNVADTILDAIDAAAGLRLRCPEAELQDYYGVGCPP